MTGIAPWHTEFSSTAPGFAIPSTDETAAAELVHRMPHGRWKDRRPDSAYIFRVLAPSVDPAFDFRPPARQWPSDVTVTEGHDMDLEEHLADRPQVRQALELAMARLRDAFPGVRFVIGLYRDPEEDWAYPLIVVVPPSEVDRERLREAVDRVAVEALRQTEADADSWLSLTIRPMWPEARR